MKDQVFSILQAVGRSFMLPVAILPIAGLLLGIGASFTNATTIQTYGLESVLGNGTILHSLLTIMSDAGNIIFGNLPIIFAVGVAIGMAKQEKEVAALSAMIAFFVMHASTNAVLKLTGKVLANNTVSPDVLEGTIANVCGIMSLQEGVFGGIIVGIGVAYLHNRYHKIVLPNALSFFGGSRFIPIISTVVYMFVGIAMYFVWPVVQSGIFALGGLVTGTGYIGTLIFGIITVPSNYQPHIDTATVLVEQLKAVGITAEIQPVEWGAWLSEVYGNRQFQSTVVGVDASNMTARALLERFTSAADDNFINYQNTDYDALFQQAQATADDAEQTELYKQMERNLTEHAANVYIQDLADLVVLRNGLEGYQFYPIYVMDLSTVHYAQ